MLCETATTKFWRRSRKKSLVKFLRKCYSIHVADYLHVFVIVGELNNTRLQTNLLHFYFLGISRCPIAIASAIWYNGDETAGYFCSPILSHPHKLHTLHRRIGSFVKLIDVRVVRDNIFFGSTRQNNPPSIGRGRFVIRDRIGAMSHKSC